MSEQHEIGLGNRRNNKGTVTIIHTEMMAYDDSGEDEKLSDFGYVWKMKPMLFGIQKKRGVEGKSRVFFLRNMKNGVIIY